MKASNVRTLISLYVAIGFLTLLFQIYVRLQVCTAAGNCGSSMLKAVVWAVIWPASWVAYLKGLVG